MAELKYEKYIVKGSSNMPMVKSGRSGFKFDPKVERPKLHHLMSLTPGSVEGSIIVICQWVWAEEQPGVQGAHTHPYDEIIGFVGTNPKDPDDLGGVAELWLENEQYFIDKTFLVYVPRNMKHCPLTIRDIKSPILHFSIQVTRGEMREFAAG